MLREIFSDKAGGLSSRRVFGAIMVIAGLYFCYKIIDTALTMLVLFESVNYAILETLAYMAVATLFIGAGLLLGTTAEFFSGVMSNFPGTKRNNNAKQRNNPPGGISPGSSEDKGPNFPFPAK